jgi:hypothetical protein
VPAIARLVKANGKWAERFIGGTRAKKISFKVVK